MLGIKKKNIITFKCLPISTPKYSDLTASNVIELIYILIKYYLMQLKHLITNIDKQIKSNIVEQVQKRLQRNVSQCKPT